MGIGETAALSAALMWTISSFLWGRIKLNAVELNICKNLVGCLLVSGHVVIILVLAVIFDSTPSPSLDAGTSMDAAVQVASEGDVRESFQLKATWPAWIWLGLSGLVGIVIGDTFYFRSLQILGPRRSLMVATTSPLFAVLTGWLMLSENLLAIKLVGIVLTIAGVMVVVGEKRGKKEAPDLFPGNQSTGIYFGILGAMCQGVGATVSKLGMNVDNCTPLEASLVRLIIAAAGSIAIILLRREGRAFAKKFFRWSLIKQLIPASAIGTWLGIWLSQISFKFTEVGIAQTLLSTSPLFAIPIVYFMQGHKISAFAILGTTVALLGIWLTSGGDPLALLPALQGD